MNTKSRIQSIIHTNQLDSSITGIPSFHLSQLNFPQEIDFRFPTHVRLGHLAERIVSEIIQSSTNYTLIGENIQLMEGKTTIGELDFLIQETTTQQISHVELAYKFYLFDPSISNDPFQNWIGPNRNDSLAQKVHKLKQKQFPLLQHPNTQKQLSSLPLDEVTQGLCLLASLYLPIGFTEKLNPSYSKAIKGYYLNNKDFFQIDHSGKLFHIPNKKDWGIPPSENTLWQEFREVENYIRTFMEEKQAPLIWQKEGELFEEFFVTWW